MDAFELDERGKSIILGHANFVCGTLNVFANTMHDVYTDDVTAIENRMRTALVVMTSRVEELEAKVEQQAEQLASIGSLAASTIPDSADLNDSSDIGDCGGEEDDRTQAARTDHDDEGFRLQKSRKRPSKRRGAPRGGSTESPKDPPAQPDTKPSESATE